MSTIRTHLHNVYRKIDAVDRAQAVRSHATAAGSRKNQAGESSLISSLAFGRRCRRARVHALPGRSTRCYRDFVASPNAARVGSRSAKEQGDRYRMGAIAGAEARQDRLRVCADGLGVRPRRFATRAVDWPSA